MANDLQDSLTRFTWERQPSAAQFVAELIERFQSSSSEIARLASRLRDETGTRLLDWSDAFFLPYAEETTLVSQLEETGFEQVQDDVPYWRHPGGIFPNVVITGDVARLLFKVESVDEFARRYPCGDPAPTGVPGSAFRTFSVSLEHGVELVAVERHGWPGFTPSNENDETLVALARHQEALRQRPRDSADAAEGFAHTKPLLQAAVDDLGVDRACDLFFATEREYWQSRNHAARVQYERQQALGLGWANHDHHTYRSSRACFHFLVDALETLGFHCRERFYAGVEAGWGAQVLEQSAAGFVVFADVDMAPEEVAGDFAHEGLPARQELGTVGLWCQLHGESFLKAGMHHLECQFDFDRAREQLAAVGVETMAPFTDFPHLRQAFTKGEQWQVDSRRIDQVLAAGQITEAQAQQFRRDGALGSHLEILERNEGYKGFNQTGVSDIISRTDPRNW